MVKDDYDIQMEKMLKRLEEIEKRTQSISKKIDTLYSKYETVTDIQTKKIDITNINERLEKLERRQKNG